MFTRLHLNAGDRIDFVFRNPAAKEHMLLPAAPQANENVSRTLQTAGSRRRNADHSVTGDDRLEFDSVVGGLAVCRRTPPDAGVFQA